MLVSKKSRIGFDKETMSISSLKLEWENKNILIVGAGATGLSCAEFLNELKIEFKIVDSRKKPLSQYGASNVICGDFQKKYFIDADVLLVSPGVSLKHPLLQDAIKQGKDVIGDVELFCRLTDKRIIAITGSNGKSTVTTLVGNILNALDINTQIGGNIGVPCLELLKHDKDTDCYVLELSSFQLETTTSLEAFAGVILNLSEDHMDRYDSYIDYCNAKKKVLMNAENIIINIDAPEVVEFSRKFSGKRTTFSLVDSSADFSIEKGRDTETVLHAGKKIMDLSRILLIGQHNKSNILAAFSLCSVFNIDLSKAVNVVNDFSGLEHRSQVVSHFNKVLWVNDSKATNIGATSAALNGLSNRNIHLILGGQAKGQDFNDLAPALTSNIKEIIVYGEDAELIISSIQRNTNINFTQVDTLDDAVKVINKNNNVGDVVLLSPACASFDQFDNYMQRGEHFIDAIARLEC